ncbi:MAG: tripartite tricarboxylate transporter substrate binding protein [Betaproteobacteria bacterium]|nr:tripartite tricarboxylate transporter substrate binding protein [Betaproteobacteria bacterium]NBT74613.1 tripartite tricarboxylate transporter substrate binding protein [Betaproteobacteria bacterium]NBY13921.1 tripartite tricarboxylate transporter substrate binding protein [Betaproteobacteria bacterium]NCA15916.1 tripartite tricarboxylate transporter substrate binding protein [Betaproteobacteria bacterium]NDF03904.1 tripartite tricarboxylate transporter substrate binding protein [Betaproteob
MEKRWVLAVATWVIMTGAACAQAFPNKPIRLIVPFAVGGPSDVLARALSVKLQESMGQPVLVENKPGGGTNLAADLVAKSKPDGYTLLLMMVGTQAINESLYPKLTYNTVRDFAPISLVASSSLMLVAHPSLAAKNTADLIALARANPGRYNFGSSGTGTPLHLAGELFNSRAGIKIIHVPYKGAAPALNDVLGGQIELAMVGAPAALPHVKAGKLTPIGLTSAKRSSQSPDIPTINETLRGFEVELVYSIVAPAGTPKDIILRLNSEIHRALSDPETASRLTSQGFDPLLSSPEKLADYIKSEISKWGPIVKQSGAQPD